MKKRKILDLGRSADNIKVVLDYDNTNVEFHLLETPDIIELVSEVLPTITLAGREQTVVERDLGRIIGTTSMVKTTNADEIVYAKRIGRDSYSRFVKNRELIPCSSIVAVIRSDDNGYYLWTAMCAKIMPSESQDTNSEFYNTHAMVFDENLVQANTVTNIKPAS